MLLPKDAHPMSQHLREMASLLASFSVLQLQSGEVIPHLSIVAPDSEQCGAATK
jgi:hypothetical protein